MRGPLAIGLLLAVVAAACAGDDDASTATTLPGDRVSVDDGGGEDLTDAVLAGLDGGEIAFADYAGRPVVVNFFASTCVPCVEEMPAIEAVKQDVGDAVAFVGVATNDRVDDAIARAEDTGVTWDLANDPRGDFIARLGGVILPTTAFVDADGRVVETHGGEIEEDELRDLLDEHFGVDA